jgi:hypothetical protein
VRHLVDTVHSGNLSEASGLTGISYPTLRDLYVGHSTGPSLGTLEALRQPYGLDLNWLIQGGETSPIPVVGRTGLVPPAPHGSKRSRELREVLIPYRAWPLCKVFLLAETRLERESPSSDRPIVGEANGDAFNFRLTTFLLQPLLATEKLSGQRGMPQVDPSQAVAWLATGEADIWIARLRQLGAMWTVLLPSDLAGRAPLEGVPSAHSTHQEADTSED